MHFKDTTLRINERDPKTGEIHGIFLHSKTKNGEQTISARKAHILLDRKQIHLYDGTILHKRDSTSPYVEKMTFETLSHTLDISPKTHPRSAHLTEKSWLTLMSPDRSLPEKTRSHMIAEGHRRLFFPLRALINALWIAALMLPGIGMRSFQNYQILKAIGGILLTGGGLFASFVLHEHSPFWLGASYLIIGTSLTALPYALWNKTRT